MLSSFSFFTLWPPTFFLIAAIAFAIYMFLVGPGSRRPASRAEMTYFITAMFFFWIGFGTPIHIIGETYLMSAHMITTMITVMAVPPLLIMAIPAWIWESAMQNRVAAPILKLLFKPLIAFAAFNFAFMLWHLPGPFDAAIASEFIHGIQDVTLFVGGIMGWMPLLSKAPSLPRMHDGVQLLYTFCCIVLQTFLFGPLMIADEPLYEVYRLAPRLIPALSALEDQQLGHLFMGVFNPLILGGIFTAAFMRMVRREERRTA